MSKFEFQKNTLELDIDGEKFEIDPAVAGEVIHSYVPKLDALEQSFKEAPNKQASVQSACETLVQLMDDVLGAGAAKRIFKDKTVSYYDCFDVYFYISGEINNFVSTKGTAYDGVLKKQQGNRKQRRAKK